LIALDNLIQMVHFDLDTSISCKRSSNAFKIR